MTYNVHQGLSLEGRNNFARVLETIRASGANIIGLQESDTSKITSANSDIVQYLATELGMYSYYGMWWKYCLFV